MLARACLLIFGSAAAFGNPVIDFLQGLIDDLNRQPSFEDGLKAADSAKAMAVSAVSGALPVVFLALRSGRETVRVNGALILFSISTRPDAKAVLNPHVPAILDLLGSSDERVQATATMVFGSMRPVPPAVVPAFESFLKDPAKPLLVQTGMVCTLVQMQAPRQETREALSKYFSRAMGKSDRIAALDALACQPRDDAQVAKLAAQCLEDSDPDVRARAVSIVGRLRGKATELARPALLRIAADPNERADVRALAERVVTQRD